MFGLSLQDEIGWLTSLLRKQAHNAQLVTLDGRNMDPPHLAVRPKGCGNGSDLPWAGWQHDLIRSRFIWFLNDIPVAMSGEDFRQRMVHRGR